MTPGAALSRTLRDDRFFHASLALGLGLLAVCRVTARLEPGWEKGVADLSDVSMLGLVLFGLLRASSAEALERRFWQLLSLAMGSWLLVSLCNLAVGLSLPLSLPLPPALELFRNVCYTGIYLWTLLALELKPHRLTADPREAAFRWLEGAGAALAALGLFVYLAGLPWLTGARVYETNVPETVLYLCLDGFLLLRLGVLVARASPAWTATYGCLLATAACWMASDGLEVLSWAGWLPAATLAPLLDALWLPQLLAFVLARRARVLWSLEPAAGEPAVEAPDSTPGHGSLLLGLTLLLPVVHATFVGLEVWEPGRHRAATIWVIGMTLALGILTALYFRGIEGLAADRALQLVQANRALAAHVTALEVARDEAEAANLAKTRFLAAMSHEIRTPMNGVLGTVSLLQRSTLDAAQQRLAATIQRSGQALLSIINEILDLSRLEAGRLKLEAEAFDVGGTVEEAADSLAELARAKGLELGCLVEGLRGPLRGDRNRFRQVLVNLVGNAIKFTERGEVAVFARALAADAETVTVRVEVADTGVGIAPESAAVVFEAFGQTSSGRRAGGTGLGLAISRQLALLMGGELDFESEAGRGSVFRLTLPLERAPQAADEPPLAPPQVRRVLIAEPSALGRFALERQCAELGVQALAVGEGEAALKALGAAAARGEAFDVALVAAGLLAAGDYDLLRRMRGDAALARTRVVSVGGDAGGLAPADPELEVLQRPVLRRSLLEALRDNRGPGAASSGGPAPGGTRPGLALVVEDNPVNQVVIEGMLGLLGWKVEVTENGAAALERLERARYDVVLLDCMMPGMDGFEVTAELRSREQAEGAARTPVVAVTAIAMTGDRERCLAAGMDDYLPKPFSIETLEAALARIAGARRAAPAVRLAPGRG